MNVYKIYIFMFELPHMIDSWLIMSYEKIDIGDCEKLLSYDEVMGMKAVGYHKFNREVTGTHCDVYIDLNYTFGGNMYTAIKNKLVEKLREDKIGKILS